MSKNSNKRIVKNTLFLYFRMFVTTVVSLLTVRIVLDVLGQADYGIYNVIGGIIVMFSFFKSALTNATQRFITYELGLNNQDGVKRIFSMSLVGYFVFSLGIVLVFETIGLWFVNHYMVFPPGREDAAIFVFHLSVLTFVLNIIQIPFNSSVIAYEKMNFYAYISILEVLLNLFIVYALYFNYSIDSLKLYALLKMMITVICLCVTSIYCKKKFVTCRYEKVWDKSISKKMLSYSGWSMLGGASVLVTHNGSNILFNIYKGVVVNAAFGISNNVSNAVYSFVSNFQLAFQPQIVKLYAENNREELIVLMNRAALFSYYLLLIIAIPFVCNINEILALWLTEVPRYTAEFCSIMIIYYLIDSIQAPLWMLIYATGNIKSYCIWSSCVTLSSIPISFILLVNGYSPVVVVFIRVLCNFINLIIRTMYIRQIINTYTKKYVVSVLLKAIPISFLILLVAWPIYMLPIFGLQGIVIKTLLLISAIIMFIWYVGINKCDRIILKNIVISKIRRL